MAFLKFIIGATLVISSSCAENGFHGGSTVGKDKPSKNAPPEQTEKSGDAEPLPKVQIDSTDGDASRKVRECWFAVSGAYLATSYYNSSFLQVYESKMIKHGQRFDDVGGIFLSGRDAPYLSTGSEIKQAVDWTFDSIAVAPGMAVEILDSKNQVLLKDKGPLFMLSSDYGNRPELPIVAAYYAANQARFPKWMQEILIKNNNQLNRIPLHAAVSVKVSNVPGEGCDP